MSYSECQFQRWYPTFKSVTIRSEVIELPSDFVTFLLQDGVTLPECFLPQQCKDSIFNEEDEDWKDAKKSQDAEKGDEEDCYQVPSPFFPELMKAIESGINNLGGAVFPMLNWRSPRDAAWIATDKTLKCKTIGDVLLLLKSSDRIVEDLDGTRWDEVQKASLAHSVETKSLKENKSDSSRPSKFYLVLRKWCNFFPSREFRCFVVRNQLSGVAQRDLTYFQELNQSSIQEKIKTVLSAFFVKSIKNRFFNHTFAFDAYVDSSFKPYLLNFKPAFSCDALLFSWDELLSLSHSSLSTSSLPSSHSTSSISSSAAQSISGSSSSSTISSSSSSTILSPSSFTLSCPSTDVVLRVVDTDTGHYSVGMLSERFRAPVDAASLLTAEAIDSHYTAFLGEHQRQTKNTAEKNIGATSPSLSSSATSSSSSSSTSSSSSFSSSSSSSPIVSSSSSLSSSNSWAT